MSMEGGVNNCELPFFAHTCRLNISHSACEAIVIIADGLNWLSVQVGREIKRGIVQRSLARSHQ